MTVSHELRTPLTAIRGHVDALREGIAEDPEAARGVARRGRAETGASSDWSATCSTSRSSTPAVSRPQEEVDMARLIDPRLHDLQRGGPRRGIDYRREVAARRDRRRRRPSPPDRHEPPRERLPLDARRGADRAQPGADNGQSPCPSSTRARESSGGARPDLPARSGRTTAGTGLGLAIAKELALALGGRSGSRRRRRGTRFELVLPSQLR